MSKPRDITVDIEDYKLNVRAAGIITHNGKILFHKNSNDTYYALVGGRVEVGEDSATTVIREILEEIGKEVEVVGYVATVENFFKHKDMNYHEILFVHKVEFKNEEDKKIEYTLKNIEGEEELNYEWLEIEKIKDADIRPEVMKNILIKNNWPIHIVNDDR